MGSEITVVNYETSYREVWQKFISASDNGTLFHDLDFLDYHPEDRFEFHHLLFYRKNKLVALLPGAIRLDHAGRTLVSTSGASIGGFILPERVSIKETCQIVEVFNEYLTREGFSAAELRLGPLVYGKTLKQHQEYALMASGYSLVNRYLCHFIHLDGIRGEPMQSLFNRRRRSYVRASQRKGVTVQEVGKDSIDEVYFLVEKTHCERHNTSATHSKNELLDLKQRFPTGIRFFLAEYECKPIGTVVLFQLSEHVANAFYICEDYDFVDLGAPGAIFDHIINRLEEEGVSWLELGPSTFDDMSINEGVAFFKESIGGQGLCRDVWKHEPARLSPSRM